MSGEGAIPPRTLPTSARAPGKCVLFGEHAVVRGAPELVLAIDLHTQVIAARAPEVRLNADPRAADTNAYFREALAAAGPAGAAVDVRCVSRIPRAAGLGSSAAFVAAVCAALGAAGGGLDRAALAQRCFDVERGAQGVGSPGDTSASVAGGYVTLNAPEAGSASLWTVRAGAERWEVRRAEDPGWTWVVAYSGVPRSTADAVRAVGARLERSDGPALLEEFGRVARDGIAAVGRGDRAEVGRLLGRNQELLRDAGVSHPRLEVLLEAAAPAALGAKLTGAGCGGSIVVLPAPGKEVELIRRLARAGALPFPARPAPGVELVELEPPAPAGPAG